MPRIPFLAVVPLLLACAAPPTVPQEPKDASLDATFDAVLDVQTPVDALVGSGSAQPTVLLLHGYGALWDFTYMMGSAFTAAGWRVIEPYPRSGWCSSHSACSGSGFSSIDEGIASDEQYLIGLVAKAPGPVYLVGHSNGAVETWRLLCDYQDAPFKAGIILEGIANSANDPPCKATAPMRVLDIHGDIDPLLSYDRLGLVASLGGTNLGSDTLPPEVSPGGFATLDQEGDQAGCTTGLYPDPAASGSGTASGTYQTHALYTLSYTRNCAGAADHWRNVWGGHVPTLTARWPQAAMAWLLTHSD